jgi:hypothetical protein
MNQQNRGAAGAPPPPAFTRTRMAPAAPTTRSARTESSLLPPFVRRRGTDYAARTHARPAAVASAAEEQAAIGATAAYLAAPDGVSTAGTAAVEARPGPVAPQFQGESPDSPAAGDLLPWEVTPDLDETSPPAEVESADLAERVAARLDEIARQLRAGGIAALDEAAQSDELGRVIAAAVISSGPGTRF